MHNSLKKKVQVQLLASADQHGRGLLATPRPAWQRSGVAPREMG